MAQNIGEAYPDARTMINEGIKLHDDDKFDEAIKKYLKVHENDSFYDLAVYELSLSYLANKQYEEAKLACIKGLNLESKYKKDFIINYANSLSYQEKIDSAVYWYDYGAKLFPYDTRFIYEKAVAYQLAKDYDNAIKYYGETIKLNPYQYGSHTRMGFMAADAGKPTLAILALGFYAMINENPDNVNSVIGTMEKIADHNYTTDKPVDAKHFEFASFLNEIDEIVLSKAALSNKYKSKLKINYKILKQMQVICEKLPANVQTDSWLINFYIKFYKDLWDKDYFQGGALHIFRNVNINDVQSQVKSKKKEVDIFTNWATEYLNNFRNKKVAMFLGKEQEVDLYYDEGKMRGMGKLNAEKKFDGYWIFYNEFGTISAEGDFKNGTKQG
ncbi:MAG: tetratricopeptide repeat protein, partial [Bacteroidia bacterium]|nr:tetratricopeptide repeat protein [Bacteroidia bacterium]